MEKIYSLVNQFREALDKAYNEDKFKKIPFSKFPNDCCSHVSDLLYWYLLNYNVRTNIINGSNIDDPFWHHVWLETESKIIIDITCDQFNGRKGFPDLIEPVHVGTGNTVHKVFSHNKQVEFPTVFWDKSRYETFTGDPNPYQKTLLEVYNILNDYINFQL